MSHDITSQQMLFYHIMSRITLCVTSHYSYATYRIVSHHSTSHNILCIILLSGRGTQWSSWSQCGITCGYYWGKRYRNQNCLGLGTAVMSPLCKNVLYFQVQPEWCMMKVKCPGVYCYHYIYIYVSCTIKHKMQLTFIPSK